MCAYYKYLCIPKKCVILHRDVIKKIEIKQTVFRLTKNYEETDYSD